MLSISPLKCLQDEVISIDLNIPPEEEVTLTSSSVDQIGDRYCTYTHYRAGRFGYVHLSTHPSLGGSYKGIFPMGPVAALKPPPGDYQFLRHLHRDSTIPLKVKFTLLKGHLDDKQALNPDPDLILDSVDHERVYLTPKSQRIPVHEGRIKGVLFIPEGDGPFPGVIDLFGIIGGQFEFRSAQFAARGIVALVLGFYGHEGLPDEIEEVDMSYIEEAAKFLLSNKKVKKSGLGVIGVSKGCHVSIASGTFIPEIKAVVAINGYAANCWIPLRYKDRVIPSLGGDNSRIKEVEPGLISSFHMANDPNDYPESHIPILEADAEFLLICGMDDQSGDYAREFDRAASVLKAHGKTNYKILKYEGMGHLFTPPYAPFTAATKDQTHDINILWGGNALEHTAATVDGWDKILKFYKRVIT